MVEVADVVVDLLPGKLLPAEAALHRELCDVIDDGEILLQHVCQVHICPLWNPVALEHVALQRIGHFSSWYASSGQKLQQKDSEHALVLRDIFP